MVHESDSLQPCDDHASSSLTDAQISNDLTRLSENPTAKNSEGLHVMNVSAMCSKNDAPKNLQNDHASTQTSLQLLGFGRQGRGLDLRFSKEELDSDFVQDHCMFDLSSICVLTSSASTENEIPLMGAVAGEIDMRSHAVIDSGATETVGSLPALEDLMSARYEIHGHADAIRVSDVPPR